MIRIGPDSPGGLPGFCIPYPGGVPATQLLGIQIAQRKLPRIFYYKRSGAAQAALLLLYIFIPFSLPSGG
ncbi:MAG: hypothetical protein QM288_01285 [Bacteroidota bacterium]|nr:hypothetical protein [Bacteroidota bacterium]